MDLVLPQLGSFRPVEGQPAPVLKEEVLSLTIKPAEFRGFPPAEEVFGTLAGQEVLKHPRRFQALTSTVPANPAPLVEEGTEILNEPDIPKRPRRFQALASAGPAKVTNRFSRGERPADPSSQNPSTAPEGPAEADFTAPKLQLPAAVLTALAKAEALNSPLIPSAIVDGTARKSKERRGVPPTLQERQAIPTMYDW